MSTRDHNPISRYQKHPTPKNANNAMCATCVGCTSDHLELGFKEDIKNCSRHDCPMYKKRPYQQVSKKALEGAEIEKLADPIRLDISSEKLANQLILSPENGLTEGVILIDNKKNKERL